MNNILMIGFHYPPCHGGSGIHRMLKFSRYLPEYGWLPVVLSASPKAYPDVSDERISEIPGNVKVCRPFALDSARHLAIGERYLKWTALPDRWVSWWFGAIPAGLRLIRRYKPKFIWSTYPIATAHLIGLTLHRLTGIPWIADFRDLMTEPGYPADPRTKRLFDQIENLTVKHCHRAVFTTAGTWRMYAERYSEFPRSKWAMIANGYDEEDFVTAERLANTKKRSNKQITLVHSGFLYTSERDPSAFFAAVAELHRCGIISPADLQIVLRGPGNETAYRQQLRQAGIHEIVHIEPLIAYHDALAETLMADGLLMFQAANCNDQIPAKVYEYLRAKRPILALVDPAGDTAGILKVAGIHTIVPLDSKDSIKRELSGFLKSIRAGAPVTSEAEIQSHSRRARTAELAALLSSSA
jgi:glycosyl transferase family 4